MRGFKRSSFLKRPKVFIPLLIVILLLGAAVSAVRNLNSPAEGTVTTQTSENSQSAAPAAGDKGYQDNFISFKYPSAYSLQPAAGDNSNLDTVNLIANQRRDQFVAITLTRETLANDSGVNYRKTHPKLYKTVSSTPQAIVFSKVDGTEYTGFLAHSDEVLAVSLTAVSATNLNDDYDQITGSLQWR